MVLRPGRGPNARNAIVEFEAVKRELVTAHEKANALELTAAPAKRDL